MRSNTKTPSKKDFIAQINRSAQELHQRIDMHLHLMSTLLEQRVSDESLKQVSFPSCSPDESRLKGAIQEAIEVLEGSRRAFKSKRLEVLRKKLTQVLIESE